MGEDNPADLFTKHLCEEKMLRCLSFLGAEYREGRPSAAPLRKENKDLLADNGTWDQLEDRRESEEDMEMEVRLSAEVDEHLEYCMLCEDDHHHDYNHEESVAQPCSRDASPSSADSYCFRLYPPNNIHAASIKDTPGEDVWNIGKERWRR